MGNKKKRWRIRLTRDGLLFVVGLAGIIHEMLFSTTQRSDLLVLFAAMVGLPAFLRTDEARKKSSKPDGEPGEGEQ